MDATKNLHTQLTLAERLRWLRENVGQSMEAFGAEIGFDKSYLSRLERGESGSPSSRFIDAVCSKYPISREWLMEGKGDPMPKGAVENATKAVDWAKISSHMSLAAKTMESVEGELSTIEVLRLIMRDMPLRERLKKILEATQDPAIKPGARVLWMKAMLKAALDPELPPPGPAHAAPNSQAIARKATKHK
jgi:transcriptional regulator with XRE-family HTH domain